MPVERSKVRATVIERAARDPEFEAWLRRDAHAAIRALTGYDLPATVAVTVLRETTERLYLVLPVRRDPGGGR